MRSATQNQGDQRSADRSCHPERSGGSSHSLIAFRHLTSPPILVPLMLRALSTPFRAACVSALLLIATACGDADEARDATASVEAIDCSRCTLRVVPLLSIRDTDGDTLTDRTKVADFGGRFVLAPVDEELVGVAITDSAGTIQRIFGRAGDGPGELRPLKAITAAKPPSRLALMGGGRLSLFDSNFTVLRQVNDAAYMQAFRFVGIEGGFAVNTYAPGQRPVLLLDDTLGVRARYGVAGTDPDSNQYHLAPASSGGVWAARGAYRYEIVKLGADGAEQRRLLPERGWFPHWPGGQYNPYRDPRTHPIWPRIVGLWEVDSSWLAVLHIVPDSMATFSTSAPDVAEGSGGDDADLADYLDTLIELIDARTGALLVSLRLDVPYFGMTTAGRLWRVAEEDEVTIVEVLQLIVEP